jgi:uncharacterized protein YigE (DUF2233 family)
MELRTFASAGRYGGAKVVAVRVRPARCRIRVVKVNKATGGRAEEVCPARGAAINASFFAEKPFMQPLGLLVCDGRRLQGRSAKGEWGAFLVRKRGAVIIKSGESMPAGVIAGVEARPRLVIKGEIPGFKPQPAARRSAVGVDAKGRVVLAASEGFLTLEQWAAVMASDLNCPNALNLDGGPSTQLCVRGKVTETVKGGWPVPVVIVVDER